MRAPALAFLCGLALAATAAPAAAAVHETMTVPTVDGATLHVEIVRPDGSAKAPVILTYSPYNILGATNSPTVADDGLATRYVPMGYARAVADVLGTRDSSGCWDYGGLKEQQSGVDLVNALAKAPWSNGKVAMIGGSYDGTTATMVAARGADVPALAGIVPESAINHWYGYAYQDGVRYFGNSQSLTDEGIDTPLGFDLGFSRTPPDQPADPGFSAALASHLMPCDLAAHTQHGYSLAPDYDSFWRERDYRKDAAKFRAAVLVVHGWQDYNVRQSEGLDLYEALPVDDPKTPAVEGVPFKRLYMFQGSHQGATGEQYEPLVDAFFAHTLLGADNGVDRDPTPVTSEGATAAGKLGDYRREASWPPPGTKPLLLSLDHTAAGGTLNEDTGPESRASFSDLSTTLEELVLQSPADERTWLWYVTKPLVADARIAGSAVLRLAAAVNQSYGQIDPVLVDVAPDGTNVPISRGFMNLDYRDGLEKAAPPVPGALMAASVRLAPQDWTVKAGHRIGLVVAASNTIWAIPEGPGATYTVLHGDGGSRLVLPIVGTADAVLPAAKAKRAKARLTIALRRHGHHLTASGQAPAGAIVTVKLLRGRTVIAIRRLKVHRSRYAVSFTPGRGRVTARAVAKRGRLVLSARSRAVRVR